MSDQYENRAKEELIKEIESLKENQELLIGRMPIGLIIWDKEFLVKTWNPAAEEIFGFTEEEAAGKHSYGLIVPKEAQPQVDDIWKRLLEGDKTAHSVNENTTKDGRTITCSWVNTPLKKADGTVVGVLSMVQDITERKEAEENLMTLEKNYKALFEGAPEGIIVADMETGQYIHVNPSICKKLGYTEKEIKDLSGFRGIHPKEEEDRIKDVFYRQAKGEIDIAEDIPFVRKDGTLLYFDVASVHVEFDGIQRVVGLLRDITERKKVEEETQKTLKELQKYKEVTVGRETRMIELKEEINRLSEELGRPKPYDTGS
jgi:PAS domain S-box-containing protein